MATLALPLLPAARTNEHYSRKRLQALLHHITAELKHRATKTPHIFLPFRLKIDDTKLELFLRRLFPDGNMVEAAASLKIKPVLREFDDFTLVCGLKYLWCRLPNNEIIGWDVYVEFARREHEAGYPKDAFLLIMPKCLSLLSHASIVYDFLDLLISIASNSQHNYLSGRKVAKMASLWAFNAQPIEKSPFYDATQPLENSFLDGLERWKSSCNGLFHLLLAFLRAMLPDTETETLNLPKTLQLLLITNLYPPADNSDLGKSAITIPCVQVRSTRRCREPYELISKVRHLLSFDRKDAFLSIENYTILKNIFQKDSTNDIVATLTEESRRILRRLSADAIDSEFGLYPGWVHSQEDLEVPLYSEVSVTNVTLQDYYIWTWLSSLALDQSEVQKSLFGRSIVVEAGLHGFHKWLILSETVMSHSDYVGRMRVERRNHLLPTVPPEPPAATAETPPPPPSKDLLPEVEFGNDDYAQYLASLEPEPEDLGMEKLSLKTPSRPRPPPLEGQIEREPRGNDPKNPYDYRGHLREPYREPYGEPQPPPEPYENYHVHRVEVPERTYLTHEEQDLQGRDARRPIMSQEDHNQYNGHAPGDDYNQVQSQHQRKAPQDDRDNLYRNGDASNARERARQESSYPNYSGYHDQSGYQNSRSRHDNQQTRQLDLQSYHHDPQSRHPDAYKEPVQPEYDPYLYQAPQEQTQHHQPYADAPASPKKEKKKKKKRRSKQEMVFPDGPPPPLPPGVVAGLSPGQTDQPDYDLQFAAPEASRQRMPESVSSHAHSGFSLQPSGLSLQPAASEDYEYAHQPAGRKHRYYSQERLAAEGTRLLLPHKTPKSEPLQPYDMPPPSLRSEAASHGMKHVTPQSAGYEASFATPQIYKANEVQQMETPQSQMSAHSGQHERGHVNGHGYPPNALAPTQSPYLQRRPSHHLQEHAGRYEDPQQQAAFQQGPPNGHQGQQPPQGYQNGPQGYPNGYQGQQPPQGYQNEPQGYQNVPQGYQSRPQPHNAPQGSHHDVPQGSRHHDAPQGHQQAPVPQGYPPHSQAQQMLYPPPQMGAPSQPHPQAPQPHPQAHPGNQYPVQAPPGQPGPGHPMPVQGYPMPPAMPNGQGYPYPYPYYPPQGYYQPMYYPPPPPPGFQGYPPGFQGPPKKGKPTTSELTMMGMPNVGAKAKKGQAPNKANLRAALNQNGFGI